MANYYFEYMANWEVENLGMLYDPIRDPLSVKAMENILKEDYQEWIKETNPKVGTFDEYMDDGHWMDSCNDSDYIDYFMEEYTRLSGWKGCAFDWGMDGDYFVMNIYKIIPLDREAMEELIFNYLERCRPTGLEEMAVDHIMEELDGETGRTIRQTQV